MRDRTVLTSLALLALVSLIFAVDPSLDLAASRLFYDPATGFRPGSAWNFIRHAGTAATWALGLAVVLPLAAKVAFPRTQLLVSPRVTLFVLATIAIAPGLIVNGILKEFWGRARPRTILEFGGDALFSRAWAIADQCERNCAFVSGEAAAVFCLVALVFVVERRWRPAALIATLAFAALVSLSRIAAGAHFLSDILIAWLITLLVMSFLHQLVRNLPPSFDSSIEAAAAGAGRALRRLAHRGPVSD